MFNRLVNSAKQSSIMKLLLLGVLFVILRIVMTAIVVELSGSDLSHIETGGPDTLLGIYGIIGWIILLPMSCYITYGSWFTFKKSNALYFVSTIAFSMFLALGFLADLVSFVVLL